MNFIVGGWSDFTDTLNTRGGTIALLFVSNIVLGVMVMHVMHHGDLGESASLIRNLFSGFAGALLVALTGKDRPLNGTSGSDVKHITTEEVVKK